MFVPRSGVESLCTCQRKNKSKAGSPFFGGDIISVIVTHGIRCCKLNPCANMTYEKKIIVRCSIPEYNILNGSRPIRIVVMLALTVCALRPLEWPAILEIGTGWWIGLV